MKQRPRGIPLAEALAWYGTKQMGECQLWTRSTNPDGYGHFRFEGKVIQAHRAAYEVANGPIPSGMVIDHRCFNRACVNPEHLRPVTPKQNSEHINGTYKNSVSQVRGVRWYPNLNKWRARVRHNGRLLHLGYFDTIEAASEAAERARTELFTCAD